MALRTVFFGTHQFAASILRGLIHSPLFDVALVMTQPDRPVGRKHMVEAPPVKTLAKEWNIPIDQPETMKNYELRIKDYDIGIVAQYGCIIPERILNAPTHGTLNVHTSLLPKYRGASPVQTAILNGESETGVTIIKMDAGMDTGPILLQKRVPIGPNDTALIVEEALSRIAVPTILKAVPAYVEGRIIPTPQDDAQATYCKKLTRDNGRIDWSLPSRRVYNLYRALQPWPGVWTECQGKRLKILDMRLHPTHGSSGTVSMQDGALLVACGDTSISVQRLQLEGRKPMDAIEFIRGHASCIGSVLS